MQHKKQARYTALFLSMLMAGLSACNSDYVKLDSKHDARHFISLCEENGGQALMQLNDERNDDQELGDYICLCNGVPCPSGKCTEDGECFVEQTCAENQETICINDEANHGNLYDCDEGKYDNEDPTPCKVEDDKFLSCNENGIKCGECLNGTVICEDGEDQIGIKKTCVNGKYQSEICPSSCHEAMDGTYDCGECVNGKTKCTNDINGKGINTICRNGQYINLNDDFCSVKISETKSRSVSCNSAGTGCGECLNNTVSCDEDNNKIGVKKICNNGEIYDEPCDGSCNSTKDDCGDCVNGKIKCIDNEDGIGFKYICTNGAYSEALGEYCKNEHDAVFSCNALNDDCGECKNGDEICENFNQEGRIKKCVNGKYQGETVCEHSYSCQSNTACGSCVNGTTKCDVLKNIGYLSECINGNFESKGPCGSDEEGNASCKNSTECSACIENTVRCENDEKTNRGIVKKCVAGEYKDDPPCEGDVSCNEENNGCGVCRNEDVKCENNSSKIGTVYVCSSGAWTVKKTCGSNSCDAAMKDCGECKNGSTNKCSNESNNIGRKYVCNNGKWTQGDSCVNVSCNSYKTACGICKIGASPQCSNNTNGMGMVTQCVNGANSTTPCNNKSCNAKGDGCGECQNNSKMCTNNKTTGQIQTCQNGSWGTSSPCGNNYSCNAAGNECGSCIDGSIKCTNIGITGQLYTCQNGNWGPASQCPSGNSCNSTTNNCGECKNNTIQNCSNNSSLIGQLKKCSNGKWTTSSCPSSYSCNSNNTNCGQCRNDTVKCDGSNITFCSNGLLISKQCKEAFNGLDPAQCTTVSGKAVCQGTQRYTVKNCIKIGSTSFLFQQSKNDNVLNFTFSKVCPNGCNSNNTACK